MAILDILHYPDKRLRTVAKPVAVVDDSIKKLVEDMFETMYIAPGIGLAATQVDVHQQVIEESDKQLSKLVLGQTGTTDAGCPFGWGSAIFGSPCTRIDGKVSWGIDCFYGIYPDRLSNRSTPI